MGKGTMNKRYFQLRGFQEKQCQAQRCASSFWLIALSSFVFSDVVLVA